MMNKPAKGREKNEMEIGGGRVSGELKKVLKRDFPD